MILFDCQQEAIEKLRRLKVGALLMEAGTGKTLAAMELIRSVEDIDAIVWLTPFQTKSNLKAEIEKHGGLHRELQIVGIESLSSSQKLFIELMNLVQTKRVFLICDESLKIKNWGAKRTQRILRLSENTEYKLILNGTLVTRNLLDMWPQFEFLSPKILKMNLRRFKNTFCEYTVITKFSHSYKYTREFITGYHNIDHLYSLLNPYIYSAELEIDTRRQYVEWSYSIDHSAREEYENIKTKYLDDDEMMARNNNIFLEMTTKMQHIYSCSSEKFELLDAYLKERNMSKIIVACKFIIAAEMLKKKYPELTILTYGKHSYGLNLQQYNEIIFWDKTWDYAQREQFEHRIYRNGQESRMCKFIDMTGNVGLETMIDKNIERKVSMSEYLRSKSVPELREEL